MCVCLSVCVNAYGGKGKRSGSSRDQLSVKQLIRLNRASDTGYWEKRNISRKKEEGRGVGGQRRKKNNIFYIISSIDYMNPELSFK